MKGNKMKTTLQNFTMESSFSAADLEDLGEAGIVNEALKDLFASGTYESAGSEYAIDRIVSLETKVVPVKNRVRVLLYGKAEIAGL